MNSPTSFGANTVCELRKLRRFSLGDRKSEESDAGTSLGRTCTRLWDRRQQGDTSSFSLFSKLAHGHWSSAVVT